MSWRIGRLRTKTDATEEPSESRPFHDSELVRILSKATAELGLQWSPPSEPALSRLDERFLDPGAVNQLTNGKLGSS